MFARRFARLPAVYHLGRLEKDERVAIMYDMLVCYDVNTLTKEGRGRLRRVARACTDFGQRVQESVFEIRVNAVQRERLTAKLLNIINVSEDSLRIYQLVGGRAGCIETYGLDRYVNFAAPIVV